MYSIGGMYSVSSMVVVWGGWGGGGKELYDMGTRLDFSRGLLGSDQAPGYKRTYMYVRRNVAIRQLLIRFIVVD